MILRLTMHGVLIVLGVYGAAGDDGIEGSKHDFSSKGWSRGQLCLPCHTPHNTNENAVAPLWNRSPTAARSYKMFDGRPGHPGPASLVCLSCHDGSTALDAYGGMMGDVFIQQLDRPRLQIGARHDLSTDHPIGVRYPDHNKGFHSKTEVQAEGTVVLPQGRVECLSCHDVHNHYGQKKLLVKSNDRSALCLTCHRK